MMFLCWSSRATLGCKLEWNLLYSVATSEGPEFDEEVDADGLDRLGAMLDGLLVCCQRRMINKHTWTKFEDLSTKASRSFIIALALDFERLNSRDKPYIGLRDIAAEDEMGQARI